LSLAAETGVPGLVLWLACIGSVFRYAYRIRKLAAPSGLATQQAWIERGLIAFLLAAVFGSYSQYAVLYLMLSALWCSAALLASASPKSEGAAQTDKSSQGGGA
jgi:O-antigen ligase